MIYHASFCLHLRELRVKICETYDVYLSYDENTHSVRLCLASADFRTGLFGIVLLLFHSVSFEEVFNSEYYLAYIYSFSRINCSLGHCFWRPALGINSKTTR